MPDWLAHLLVPIWCERGSVRAGHSPVGTPFPAPAPHGVGRGDTAGRPPAVLVGSGGSPWRGGTHLQPDHALPGLHLGLVKIPLLLLRVLDADVHAALHPLRLGLTGKGGEEGECGGGPGPTPPGAAPTVSPSRPSSPRSHHARQRQQRHLHLRQVPALEQVVGFEEVHGVHAVAGHGLDEVGEVLELRGGDRTERSGPGGNRGGSAAAGGSSRLPGASSEPSG